MGEAAGSRGETAHGRRFDLLQLVRDHGRLEVSSVSSALKVSPETVRRDLRLLEAQGLVTRAYGVVQAVESGRFESPLSVRADINPEEKSRIAAAAVQRIGEAQTLFIDEGFTSQLIAQRLPDQVPLTVVTASLPIGTLLAARPNVQVIVLGGRVRGNTLGVVDQWAAEMLARLTIDLAFIGANGISLERGLTTPDPAVAVVKAAAMRASVRRVLYGAHHKFGQASFVRFAGLDEFELVITGHELPAAQARHLQGGAVPLLRV